MSGQMSYHAGAAAEDIVARLYETQGFVAAKRRWRSDAGEIDLIVTKDRQAVFVEVKKSDNFAKAAQRVSNRQLRRILASAEIYLTQCSDHQVWDARVDVALVDQTGAVEVLENVSIRKSVV